MRITAVIFVLEPRDTAGHNCNSHRIARFFSIKISFRRASRHQLLASAINWPRVNWTFDGRQFRAIMTVETRQFRSEFAATAGKALDEITRGQLLMNLRWPASWSGRPGGTAAIESEREEAVTALCLFRYRGGGGGWKRADRQRGRDDI